MQGIDFIRDLAVILAVAGGVGWLFQRLGLSVFVGFLVAGILVGPYTPPFSLITDEAHIGTAARVGMVFLMFSLGLRLSVRKLRRLGGPLLLAVLVTSGILYYLTRALGAATGFAGTEGMFLAGILMISSSAVVGKVLLDAGATHERAGQLAMGLTVLEDVIAVILLTVLNSLVQMGATDQVPRIGETLGQFSAFVVLAGIGGLLVVPWLLRRMSISAGGELQTLVMAGLLFGLAYAAYRAGYSPALGAFLLGSIVAETPHRHQVERTFEGMRDIFSAVFFVAIGMQVDLEVLGGEWLLILGVTGFTLVARMLAASIGLVVIGTAPKEAVRAGLALTPIGEFSFIIAQLGVTAAVVRPQFYPLAVGVSLLTTLAAPFLTRHSEPIAGWMLENRPRWLEAWLSYYRGWLGRLQARRKRNLLWQLSRKRFIQIGVEVLFVSGLLGFSEELFGVVERWLGRDWLFPRGPTVLYWLGLSLVVLAPLLAIWRNIGALALLYAQVSTHGHPRGGRLSQLVETCIKIGAGMALFLWLSSFLPAGGAARWLMVVSALLAVAALLVLKRKLVYWHSELEVELEGLLVGDDPRMNATAAPWLRGHSEWNLRVLECVLPDLADCQGNSIAHLQLRSSFGCTVVGIERQGCMISLPPASTVLYPCDKVLLLGTDRQVAAGRAFLTRVSGLPLATSEFEDVSMEALTVPAESRTTGRVLRTFAIGQTRHVQVAGIHRGGARILNPGPGELLKPGDELLVLGTPDQLRAFKEWLHEDGDEPEASTAGDSRAEGI